MIRNKQESALVLSPPTNELQEHLLRMHKSKGKNTDPEYGFFSQNHLSYLRSHHMGHYKHREGNAKPLWDLDFATDPEHAIKPLPSGLSTTISVYVRQFSTACKNLWNGNMVPYLLHRTILVLLRFALAPEREQRVYDNTQKRRKAKAEHKALVFALI